VDSKKLNAMLIENFPNLIYKYKQEVEWQEGDDTGSHTVYGDVLAPYLVECIKQNNESEVIKILNFVERILKLNIKYSNEVVAFSILERIEYEYRNSALLNKNYGENSKRVIGEIRKFNS
jgi:hypothetical protein